MRFKSYFKMRKPYITVGIGQYRVKIPKTHESITKAAYKELMGIKDITTKKWVSAVCQIPQAARERSSENAYLRLYRLSEHLQDIPDVISNEADGVDFVRYLLHRPYNVFETGRALIAAQSKYTGTVAHNLYELFYDYEMIPSKRSIAIGVRLMEAYSKIYDSYSVYEAFQEREITDTEEMAGIKRLQSFGVYPTLSRIAEKYSVTPDVIEQKPAGWVLKEWAYMEELEIYQREFQQLSKK